MAKTIEDIINTKLNGDPQKNALSLIAHIRATAPPERFPIIIHDEKDESGWNISNLGFMIITGYDDFLGPWTMWLGTDNLGEHFETTIDEQVKEFAWKHVSPCGNCGGKCSPGETTKVFGKIFENTCQANLVLVNPNADEIGYIKQLVDYIVAFKP